MIPRLYKKSGNIFLGRIFHSLLVWIFHQLLLSWFVFTTMEHSGQNLKWRQPRCVSSLQISQPTCRHFPRNNRRHTDSLTKSQGVIFFFKSMEMDPTPWEWHFLNPCALPSETSASALNLRRQPSVSISEIVTEYSCSICWFPIILTFYQLRSFLGFIF